MPSIFNDFSNDRAFRSSNFTQEKSLVSYEHDEYVLGDTGVGARFTYYEYYFIGDADHMVYSCT